MRDVFDSVDEFRDERIRHRLNARSDEATCPTCGGITSDDGVVCALCRGGPV